MNNDPSLGVGNEYGRHRDCVQRRKVRARPKEPINRGYCELHERIFVEVSGYMLVLN